MTRREAIEFLETMPIATISKFDECSEAITMAIKAFKKQEKYKWHDIRKNADDVPREGIQVLVYGWNYHYVLGKYGKFRDGNETYIGFVKDDAWSWNEKLKDVIAWRYIEPFEEGEIQ